MLYTSEKSKGVMKMDAFDIIVLGGQSNAVGCGKGNVENAYVPDPRILCLTDDAKLSYLHVGDLLVIDKMNPPTKTTVTVAAEAETDGWKIGKFVLPFAARYAEQFLEPDRKVLIVDAAAGGTGFARKEWGVDAPLYERMVRLTGEALAMNPENRIVAFLWHQGEHDAFENADWDAERRYRIHKENLTALLGDFFARFGNMPFIAGGFCDEWYLDNKVACDAVLTAIREYCAEVNGRFVETAGLESNHQKVGVDDVIHFCKEAQYKLAELYFEKYLELR